MYVCMLSEMFSRQEQEAAEQGRRIKMDWTTRSRSQNGPQKVTEFAHINSTFRTWRVLRSWNFCRTIFALQDSQGCGSSGCIMHEDHAGPSARFATQFRFSAYGTAKGCDVLGITWKVGEPISLSSNKDPSRTQCERSQFLFHFSIELLRLTGLSICCHMSQYVIKSHAIRLQLYACVQADKSK